MMKWDRFQHPFYVMKSTEANLRSGNRFELFMITNPQKFCVFKLKKRLEIFLP